MEIFCHSAAHRLQPWQKRIVFNADDDSHNIWLAMHIFYESWLHRVEWWYRNGSMFCSFFSKDRQCRKENEYIKNYPFRTIVNSIHVFYWPSVMNLLALKCSAKNNWIVWYLSWNTKKYVNYAHSGLRKWVMDQVILNNSMIVFCFPWNPYRKTDGTNFLICFPIKNTK